MSVINDRLDFLSDVLEDFCIKNQLELASADDILYSQVDERGTPLTDYEKDWLTLYISVWDTIANDWTKRI